MMTRQQDQHSRVFYGLSALVLDLLRSPPTPIPLPSTIQISPVALASLLLGISLALMLCGSITFFLGFILMPWVIGLGMMICVAGIVSTIFMLGRSILCNTRAPGKQIPAWGLL